MKMVVLDDSKFKIQPFITYFRQSMMINFPFVLVPLLNFFEEFY